jgi:hypothetical protein
MSNCCHTIYAMRQDFAGVESAGNLSSWEAVETILNQRQQARAAELARLRAIEDAKRL